MCNDIGFVCVHYNPKNVLRTIRTWEKIRRSVPIQKTIFVANSEAAEIALKVGKLNLGESYDIIHHNNSGMEFGAYQAGVDRLRLSMDPEWIIFANDTFSVHQNFGRVYRKKLAADSSKKIDSPAIIGQIVSLPRSYQIAGMRTHRWVTTNLFAVNRAGFKALGSRIYRRELESLVNETAEMGKFFSANLDPMLREHLEAWLFRAHPGWHWYASAPLGVTNVEKMAGKARSIIQEKYLSAYLENIGATFVDLNDLSLSKKVQRQIERKIFDLSNSRT